MKKTHIIGLLVIALCVGILVSVLGSSGQYVSFEDAAANPNKEFYVMGYWVKDQGLTYDPAKDPNYFAFPLKDEKGDIRTVEIRNNKPQDFERSEKIVVIGKMKDDRFVASSILMKCPSKYNDGMEVKVKSLSSNE